MARPSTIEEFVERARTLCNTSSRNLRKEAENFFQVSRSQDCDNTFQICLDILSHTISAPQGTDLAPEELLASQTLCWICKHKSVTGAQMLAVSEILIQLAARHYQAKHPLVVQISSAVSAALVTSSMRIGSSGTSWCSTTVESMFSIAAERNISTQLWLSYILSVLSTMPEVAASKDVILLVCTSSAISCHVAADASVLKSLLVAAELLKETHIVELTTVQAASFVASSQAQCDSADFLADIMRCCTLWVNFAAQTLQTRLPAATSTETVLPLFVVAVQSINVWLRSSIMSTAINYLQCGHVGAGAEACLEMCVALCNAVDLGDNFTSGSKHPVEAHLCHVAVSLSTQLLPALSALLSTTSAVCNDALRAQNSQKTDATQVEAGFEKCLIMARCAAECATALLPRAYKPLFTTTNGTGTSVLSTEQLQVAKVWVTFVNTFQEFIQKVCHSTHTLQNETQESDMVEFVCSQRQQLLEVGLAFVSDLAEATYSTNSANTMNNNTAQCDTTLCLELVQLTSVVNMAVENVLVAAVRASAFTRNTTNIDQCVNCEEFDEFRNYMRDCLRLLVTSVPSLCLWLINHTVQLISALSSQVYTNSANNHDNVMARVDWVMAEALLHALSAVTKHIQSQARAASGESLLNATFQLAHLLTSEDVCCACRPLSRMCVVLYAELTPIFLEILSRLNPSISTSITTTSIANVTTTNTNTNNIPMANQEEKIMTVVCVLRAMIVRLILSLYHPEMPFHAPHPLPTCIDAVHSVPNTSIFLLDSDSRSVNMDSLCLEGCFIPFRVKQDHIGAVSLQKALTALLTHIVLHPQNSAELVRILNGNSFRESTNTGLFTHLPGVVKLIQESNKCILQQQNVSAGILHMRHSAFTNSPDGTTNNIAQTMLSLTLFHLTSLQQLDSAQAAMTVKSFHLQLQALFLCLLIPSNPTQVTAQSIVSNIGALLVPICASIAHILNHRSDTGDNTHVSAYVSHCCCLLNVDETCVNAVMELSLLLCAQCTLAQLFSILSALIQETRSTCASAAPSLAGAYYSALLCSIEMCVPLLEMLVRAAKHTNLALTEAETDALCAFLSACSCIEYSTVGVGKDTALSMQATGLLLSLQEHYLSLLREENAGMQRQLLLPVALVAIKSVCTWSAVVDVSLLFRRIVSEVSVIGIQIAETEARQKRAGQSTKQVSKKDRADYSSAFFVLLQFWNVCLSRTVLLPMVESTRVAAVSTKKGTRCVAEVGVKLPFEALGWNTLGCILAQVCRNFEALYLNQSAEPLTDSFCHDHVDSWDAALNIITLSLGPLNVLESASVSSLDTDGRVSANALKEISCREEPAGTHELVDWLVQSGTAEQLSRALLSALLQSSSTPSAAASSSSCISPSSEQVQVVHFPSELREDCLACLIKLVLCLGAVRARVSLQQALMHPQCPRNGVLGTQSADMAQKVTIWVDKLLAQGKIGDWKKFRSHTKTLCRG